MKKKIFGMIAAFVGLGIAAYYIHSTSGQRAMNNGNVVVVSQPTPDASTSPDSTAQPQQPATGADAAANSAAQTPVATPVAIPLNRIPPNGAVFKGTGQFVIYREGDITWRLDSATGNACVIFATNAQWSKPNVYDHGCGAS